MHTRHIRYAAALTALLALEAGSLPAAAAEAPRRTHIVRPGQSIQEAVDDARPGDTVLVMPGTYRQSVQISDSDITLRGVGRGTVLKPGTVHTSQDADAGGADEPAGGREPGRGNCPGGGGGGDGDDPGGGAAAPVEAAAGAAEAEGAEGAEAVEAAVGAAVGRRRRRWRWRR
ncbi:hypothetical protein [Streptomyces sp. XD-27]|uniref:hypothetical protein n=1 Tax=Streptomyces sp. XD-27 TaxID=3062779 RepID=UPI00350E5BE6